MGLIDTGVPVYRCTGTTGTTGTYRYMNVCMYVGTFIHVCALHTCMYIRYIHTYMYVYLLHEGTYVTCHVGHVSSEEEEEAPYNSITPSVYKSRYTNIYLPSSLY